MFGILKSAAKAASAVIDVPVSVAADVVTMGGLLSDQDESYTSKAASRLVQNVADMADPEGDE